MPESDDQQNGSTGATSATAQDDQQGIVEKPDWKEALDILAKTDPAKAEALTKKIEGYDRVLTKKLTNLSQREREIKEVADSLKAASAKPSGQSTGQKLRTLDAQIEATTDPAAREGLRQLKDAIREESEDRLKELEARWEKKFQDADNASRSVARIGLGKEIKSLEEVYGEELIEKYKGDIESQSLKFPGAYSPDRWLHTLAEPDELRQALRIRQKKEDSKQPNGQEGSARKQAPPASTQPKPVYEQYKGKNVREIRTGLDKAIGDGVKAGLGALGFGRK